MDEKLDYSLCIEGTRNAGCYVLKEKTRGFYSGQAQLCQSELDLFEAVTKYLVGHKGSQVGLEVPWDDEKIGFATHRGEILGKTLGRVINMHNTLTDITRLMWKLEVAQAENDIKSRPIIGEARTKA